MTKYNRPMQKISVLFFLLLSACCLNAQTIDKVTDPVAHVNTLMGTDSRHDLSTANTYPSISLPWGMNCWTPQTGKMGHGSGYHDTDDKHRRFKQAHQPSPWINDYCFSGIMPVTRKAVFREDDRASWFSHKSETATPYYYSVYLADHDVTTEIT